MNELRSSERKGIPVKALTIILLFWGAAIWLFSGQCTSPETRTAIDQVVVENYHWIMQQDGVLGVYPGVDKGKDVIIIEFNKLLYKGISPPVHLPVEVEGYPIRVSLRFKVEKGQMFSWKFDLKNFPEYLK